jgi:hypothetical protein
MSIFGETLDKGVASTRVKIITTIINNIYKRHREKKWMR